MDEWNDATVIRWIAEAQEAQAAKRVTPHDQLIEALLHPSVPKTEREHAAAREIEKLLEENERMKEQLRTCEKPDTDLADDVTKAMRRAWYLGQKYWMLGDSESRSDHRKADETEKKFEELMKEIRDLVLTVSAAMKGEQ